MDDPARNPSHLAYRAEVDGLRAIAVLAVVFFHMRVGCPGGYVGVDVFFVISGFLITSLLLRDLETTGFRLIDFWERRVRRIVPALSVTVAVTLLAGWFFLLPDDFVRLGQAAVAQALLSSNLFHWQVSGYFGPDAETLPLLHTWSLAVEEQFCILLPLALAFVYRRRRSWLKPLLWMTCGLSFLCGAWMVRSYPNAAFYWLPPRAWELLLGALLAVHSTPSASSKPWIRETVGAGSLAAVLASIFWFDIKVPFPGVATLLPTLGTVGFIWASGRGPTLGGTLLSWSPIVFIGKVSYSFYLFHWPVMAFSNYWFKEEMTSTTRVHLMILTFLASVISYFVVEKPVRSSIVLRSRSLLFLATGAVTVLLMSAGALIHWDGGAHTRLDARSLAYAKTQADPKYQTTNLSLQNVESGQLFEFGNLQGPVKCLVWGDSHAMAMMPALDDLCTEHGVHGYAATYPSTAPLLGFISKDWWSMNQNSPRFSQLILQQAIERQVRLVFLIAMWPGYTNDPQFGPCLKETVKQLTTAGIQVVIMRHVAMQSVNVPRALTRAMVFGQDVQTIGVPIEQHRKMNIIADQSIDEVAGPQVTILDPTPYFVKQPGLYRAEMDGAALYWDTQHLSPAGARRLKPLVAPVFSKVRTGSMVDKVTNDER